MNEQGYRLKIWRSPHSVFGHAPEAENLLEVETYTADAVYTDEELSRIADGGFNGIWLHGQLHNLVRHPLIPELGLYAEQQRERLRSLITRAARHGIKVFLCCQPPRAVSEEFGDFWQVHADLAGAIYPLTSKAWEIRSRKKIVNFISLCTSLPQVRQYIQEGFASLSAALPDLGGYILISGSEYPSHCVSHRCDAPCEPCPRCSKRPPEDVIAELINCVAAGVRSVAPSQAVIAWEWGWEFAASASPSKVIAQLDRSVIFMGNCEFDAPKLDGTPVSEYAFCVSELSPVFRTSVEQAKRRGLSTFAKLQLNVTHELSTITNIPAPGQLFDRAVWIKNSPDCAGYLGCWNFGNEITCNTYAFNYFLSPECPAERTAALSSFATRQFPGCDADMITRGWECFAEAIRHYPHCIPWLYYGPTNWALGYLPAEGGLGKICGRSWRPEQERGDDLSQAIPPDSIYQLPELLVRFERMVRLLAKGLECFAAGFTVLSTDARRELAAAHAMYACFRSTLNMLKIYREKTIHGQCIGKAYRQVMADELANVEAVLPWLELDGRQGYHSEAHEYMFTAAVVRQKRDELRAKLQSGRTSAQPGRAMTTMPQLSQVGA